MNETKLIYKNDDGVNIEVTMDVDVNLTQAFAHFINFTRMIGYHPHSWVNVLKDINVEELNEAYSAYDWAVDTIYG